MKNLFSLEGRVALITGGSRGIGKMIAKGFIAHGARVYISSRKADACEETAKELSQDGGKCVALPVDVSTNEGVAALAAAYGRHESKLDILVNNAGAAWLAEFDAFPEKGWDKVVDLNLKAPFFLTQALHGALRAAARPDRAAICDHNNRIRCRPHQPHTSSCGSSWRRRPASSPSNPPRTWPWRRIRTSSYGS